MGQAVRSFRTSHALRRMAIILEAGVLTAIIAAGAGPALAGTRLQGAIVDENGKPVPGALISATGGRGLFVQSVYSDAGGRFHLLTGQRDLNQVRTRVAHYADVIRDLS